ncbi:MAG: hypothetical protein MUF79_10555 [Burkholderiales bacterium]|jgi:hypothetical protein|nr:hypothetical protein [Burkholderiales bacterium]
MLKIFTGAKHDHPMADLKEARRLVAELPSGDPIKALEELAHWFESIRAEPFVPAHRAQLALLLDEAGQSAARRLGREYVAAQRLSKVQEIRWWNALNGFWRESAQTFVDLLKAFEAGEKGADALKSSVGLLAVRALRALATQMKWLYIRYGPLEQSVWGMAGGVMGLAEWRKVARAPVQVYAGIAGDSTPEQEFLRMVLLSVSSPDSLLPLEVDIADRLIAAFVPGLVVTPTPQSESTYWIDIAAGSPPLRHARPPEKATTVRYISTAPAADKAASHQEAIVRSRAIPAELGLGDAYELGPVAEVLAHLATQWSAHPPARRHERHRVKARLTVAPGFDGALDMLQPDASLAFTGEGTESWIVENVSAGGFGAVVTQAPRDWVKIDGLLALQPEGGTNWVLGVIRRITREAVNQAGIGIQTIARAPTPVEMRVQAGNVLGLDSEIGILAAPLRPGDRETRLVTRAGVHAPGQGLVLESDGRQYVLSPKAVAERGADYELLDCNVMMREAG